MALLQCVGFVALVLLRFFLSFFCVCLGDMNEIRTRPTKTDPREQHIFYMFIKHHSRDRILPYRWNSIISKDVFRFSNVRETRLFVFESVIRTWKTMIPRTWVRGTWTLSWLTQTIDANAGEMSGRRPRNQITPSLIGEWAPNARTHARRCSSARQLTHRTTSFICTCEDIFSKTVYYPRCTMLSL